jgi:hypothetical protein
VCRANRANDFNAHILHGAKTMPSVASELSGRSWAASSLVSREDQVEAELPSLECKEQCAEIASFNAPSINDHAGLTGIFVPVQLDAATDYRFGDLPASRIRYKMRYSQRRRAKTMCLR